MNFYKKKVMYLSSVGGHLDQLLRIANYINIENSIFIVNDRTDFECIMIGKTIRITHAKRSWKQIINFIEALFINHKTKYGIDGESIHEAGKRVENLISDLEKKKLLMASHGGTIKSAITNLIKSPDSKAASAFTIPNNLGVSCLVPKDNKYFLWSYNVGKIGYENISYNK